MKVRKKCLKPPTSYKDAPLTSDPQITDVASRWSAPEVDATPSTTSGSPQISRAAQVPYKWRPSWSTWNHRWLPERPGEWWKNEQSQYGFLVVLRLFQWLFKDSNLAGVWAGIGAHEVSVKIPTLLEFHQEKNDTISVMGSSSACRMYYRRLQEILGMSCSKQPLVCYQPVENHRWNTLLSNGIPSVVLHQRVQHGSLKVLNSADLSFQQDMLSEYCNVLYGLWPMVIWMAIACALQAIHVSLESGHHEANCYETWTSGLLTHMKNWTGPQKSITIPTHHRPVRKTLARAGHSSNLIPNRACSVVFLKDTGWQDRDRCIFCGRPGAFHTCIDDALLPISPKELVLRRFRRVPTLLSHVFTGSFLCMLKALCGHGSFASCVDFHRLPTLPGGSYIGHLVINGHPRYSADVSNGISTPDLASHQTWRIFHCSWWCPGSTHD